MLVACELRQRRQGEPWIDGRGAKAKQDGSPVTTEFLTGLAKDYMNACGGIGCRDLFTQRTFEALGINCYFSGCITLTLPEQPRRKPELLPATPPTL